MIKLRIFVSSVQKEMAEERRAVKGLVTSDPFLDELCVAILYEDEPSMLKPSPQGYLNDLAKCQFYLVIIGSEYGKRVKGLSATHHEYHFAQKKEIPVLACVSGDNKVKRDSATLDFIDEIRDDGHKYHRFSNSRELQSIVLTCLSEYIKKNYHVAPSQKDAKTSQRTVATSSSFDQERLAFHPDTKILTLVGWKDVDVEIARQLVAKTADTPVAVMRDADLKELLLRRGLLWPSKENEKVYCSPAGILLFAKDPTKVYPQSCIRLVAFQGELRDPKPIDSMDITSPIPRALELALRFIDMNTRHPMRVEGMRRLRLDEYPIAALREALINAMAHRDYEDTKRKIHIELFRDRIEVISPGLLPHGISLEQLRSGKLNPCSRNPVIAQGLRLLGLMEELGTGVVRMKQAMLDHGLKQPEYSLRENCLVVTFRGPGADMSKLKTDHSVPVFDVRPSVVETLNRSQKAILHELLQKGQVRVAELTIDLGVTAQAVRKDLAKLHKLGLIEQRGAARATYYVLNERQLHESATIRNL
jgi:predicted HTH transcriptional regulator